MVSNEVDPIKAVNTFEAYIKAKDLVKFSEVLRQNVVTVNKWYVYHGGTQFIDEESSRKIFQIGPLSFNFDIKNFLEKN
jgi:hypothetical protein